MQTYRSLCTQYYEIDKPEAPPDALTYYLHHAKRAQGLIYEPMCGTGRFLIPMLAEGLNIEGSDASAFMLDVCKAKCHEKNLTPKLYQCYLEQIITDRHYALIFIPSGSFGLITDITQVKLCLKNLYYMLEPNGKLIFEIEPFDALPKNLGVERRSEVQGKNHESISLKTISTYHPATQVLQTICCYEQWRDNKVIKVETEDFQVRYYQDNEIDAWLQQTGFTKFMHLKQSQQSGPYIKDNVIIYECIK